MGWQITIKEIKGESRYKIWSTITDSYITPKWLNRDEVITFIFWEELRRFFERFMKDAMTFPNDWTKKDGSRIFISETKNNFINLMLGSDDMFYLELYKTLDKFGLSVDIHDGKYFIGN
jgi:hypothetical protein